VVIATPVPRPHRAFWAIDATAGWRSHATLGLLPVLVRFNPGSPTIRRPFARRGRRRSRADDRSELGPCSLDPDRSFWSAFAERIRDQTSPTDFCNMQYDVRARTRARDPRWDGGHDLLPFLTVHAAFLAEAVTRGEPRYARSLRPRCRFLPLAQVCPTAISTRPRHLRWLAPAELSGD
jgi:hypothetical protein